MRPTPIAVSQVYYKLSIAPPCGLACLTVAVAPVPSAQAGLTALAGRFAGTEANGLTTLHPLVRRSLRC